MSTASPDARLPGVRGIRLATVAAGIRRPDRPDLVLVELAADTSCAAIFTRNAFSAAPVQVARRHLATASPRYLLINAGNANAGLGRAGLEAARRCCEAVADRAACPVEAVLPFSTGVIGEPLPVDRIEASITPLLGGLEAAGWEAAARGIMTTDTVPKAVTRRLQVGDVSILINGIAKGAGMIHPDMATMLCFVATDAPVASPLLQAGLRQAVDRSLHCITIDGDTSTNDACVLMATGQAGGPPIESAGDPRAAVLQEGLEAVLQELAQAIVQDAEGATKFITVQVEGGRDRAECLGAARTIALSPLVKTAFFASDPNWGRILAALGRAPLPDLDVSRVSIDLDEVAIVREGERAAGYEEAAGRVVMARPRITVRVRLGRGEAQAHVWTSDLSHDYVRINAEYRT